jgi:hypothetical protein
MPAALAGFGAVVPMKTRAEHVASYKARNRAKGLCGSCPRPWTGKQQLCDRCRAIKSETAKAKLAALHAAREAAGEPRRPVGWNGLQARPHDIYRGPRNPQLIAIAQAAAVKQHRMNATKDVLRDVRRRLIDVRGITPEQITALLPIFLRVHRLGIEREKARAHQLHYRRERRSVA